MVVTASYLNWVAKRPVREAGKGEREVDNTTLMQETNPLNRTTKQNECTKVQNPRRTRVRESLKAHTLTNQTIKSRIENLSLQSKKSHTSTQTIKFNYRDIPQLLRRSLTDMMWKEHHNGSLVGL